MKRNLLLALLLATSTVFGQFSNDPAVNAVVRDSSGPEEVVPICALNPLFGTTYVSWFNQNASSSYDFSMQAMDEMGYQLLPSSGLTVSNYPQSSAIFVYDTKVDHENNMVSAFQDERSGLLDIVAYRVDALGNFNYGNAGISLTDSAASGGIAPNVGILANNDAVIAWIASGNPKDWISFQKISPAGITAYSSPKRIIDSTNVASYSRPQVVSMLNDDFMILYIEQTGSGLPASKMFMQRFNAAGNSVWSAPVQISSKLIGFAAYPSIVPDGNNGAYIAYSSGNPTNPSFNDVYVQHIDENGVLWSVDGTEACTSTLTQRMSPKVRFENGMTNPMVLIKETDGSQGSAGVTVQSFDSVGNRLLGPDGVAVTPITAAYDEPYDMRKTSDGMIILYAEGLFGNQQLYATKIDMNGSPLWTPANVTLSSVASNKSRAQLTPAYLSPTIESVIAVWEDDRQDVGIYTQNINNDGTIGIITNVSALSASGSAAIVFPNPSTDVQSLLINSTASDLVKINLYDVTGKLISNSDNQQIISGSNEFTFEELFGNTKLSPGVYTIRISGTRISENAKFVVR